MPGPKWETIYIRPRLEARPTRWRWEVCREDGEVLRTFATAEHALAWVKSCFYRPLHARHGDNAIEINVPMIELLRSRS